MSKKTPRKVTLSRGMKLLKMSLSNCSAESKIKHSPQTHDSHPINYIHTTQLTNDINVTHIPTDNTKQNSKPIQELPRKTSCEPDKNQFISIKHTVEKPPRPISPIVVILQNHNIIQNVEKPLTSIIAEPESIIAEPESIIAEHESKIAEPESIIAEPESIIAEPGSTIAEPESIISEPESIIGEPESIIGEPESIIGEPENIIGEPESIIAEPKSIIAEPESIIAELESIIAEPESIIGEQDSTEGIDIDNLYENLINLESNRNNCSNASCSDEDINRPGTPEIDEDDEVRDPDYTPLEDDAQSDAQSDNPTEPICQQKRKLGPENWSRRTNKRLRMQGKAYKGVKKIDGHFTYSSDKGCRKLKERKCTKTCDKRNRCRDLTDDDRQKICTGFWENMDWKEKKVFVNSLVDRDSVQERTVVAKDDTGYRRNGSYKYYLKNGNQKLQVCKSLFLSTLCLGEKTVYAWIANTDDTGIPAKSPGKRRSTGDAIKSDSAKNFLQNLPKLPSHYCRSSSKKNYLEPVFSTSAELYKVYKSDCLDNGRVLCGRKLFFEVFHLLNIALFSPKKDRCDLCCSYEAKNLDEAAYIKHIDAKEAARAEKNGDKQRATDDPSIVVLTMDLQALLLSPKLNASALYYKTKLGCHNFTIYDVVSKDVQCYFWYESQGDLCASSFASCVDHYLQHRINDSIKEVIIYSDGCTYQNRNIVMANTLLLLSSKFGIKITQKYLERGHTQMECDSIHAVIERTVGKKPIYVPQNYVDKIREARVNPFAYRVEVLNYTFFKDYSSLGYYSSIRPGLKVGDPVVTSLRVLEYTGDQIRYKNSYSEELQDLPRRSKQKNPNPSDEPQILHHFALPLKKKKFDHLQDLKPVIPKDYHHFYDNLPHE